MSLEIKLLGSVQLQVNNEDIPVPGAKLRTILAVLAYSSEDWVQRDELIEELDLTRTTVNTTNTFHAHIARLRKCLDTHCPGSDLIVSGRRGYRLNIERSAVDAHRFTDLVDKALNLSPGVPSVVATILDDALRLWRGRAMHDINEGPLTVAAADELHRARAAAREALVEAWLDLGSNDRIVRKSRPFIADDPLNERMWGFLIVALRRVGRYAEAVESYNKIKRTLQEELDIGPGHELRASVGDLLSARY